MTTANRLDPGLWRLTARQHGVISHAQLTAAGFSQAAIRHRREEGRLWPIHLGVYAVGRPDLPKEGRWMAAVLACGPGAALSHSSAAALYELSTERKGARPHVTAPSQAGRTGSAGLIIHRAATLTESNVHVREGIRVTTILRTLLDLTLILDEKALQRVLREAEYRHRLDLAELRRRLDDEPYCPKHGRLRRILDAWVPGIGLTESELEARFLSLCARSRLPMPRPQFRIRGRRADFAWSSARLIAEVDGYKAHSGRIAFADDRAKDRRLTLAGWRVLRFTWPEVVGKPRSVAAELEAGLASPAGSRC